MDVGRKHDIAEIKKAVKSGDSLLRKAALASGEKIRKEQGDGYLRSARESLIREKLKGNQNNVRDISEQIYKHNKHSQDVPIGPSSFSFSLPESFWKK